MIYLSIRCILIFVFDVVIVVNVLYRGLQMTKLGRGHLL